MTVAMRWRPLPTAMTLTAHPKRLAAAHCVGRPPRLSAAAQWEHVGSYYMDASNTQKYDGHDLINLALNLNVREGISLEGRVLNLFDEEYAKRADVWFGDKRYFPGEPRRFMFAVKAAY